MKILHVTDNYPPATGGLERAVQALAHGLAEAGDEVRVATLGRPDAAAEQWDGPVRVHRLTGFTRHLSRFSADKGHQFHPTVPDPQLVRQLRTLIEQFRPDVVHAHGWILHSCLALRLSPRTRLVVSLHDYSISCAKMTRQQGTTLDTVCPGPKPVRCLRCASQFYGAVKAAPLVLGLAGAQHFLDRVSMFLPITEAVAEVCLPGVAADRVRVLPAFLADSVFTEANGPRPDFLPTGEFILFVGALGPHKGLDTLLAAHRRQATDIPLVLIGPSRADTPVIADASERAVTVHAGVPHEQIMRAYRAATLTVVPSRWAEPQGLVAVEAMAAGSAVIASRVGGLAELVSGDCAELVEPGDPDQLAATMDWLIADPLRRADLRRNGLARAAGYAGSGVIPRARAAYAAATESTPSPA